jgi:uncharacterized protein YqhQ
MPEKFEEKIMPVGGQAVIEGVMMRSPKRIATAIRRANGKIEVRVDEFESLVQKHPWLNVPIVRGAITLIEVMIQGIKTLQWSADKAIEDAEAEEEAKGKKKKKKNKKKGMSTAGAVFSMTTALLVGVAFFYVLPLYLTTALFNVERQALTFNLFAGIIRIIFFVLYIWGISFMKDVRRLFEYHGAEHKTVFGFEDRVVLSPENLKPYTTFHPRCGTSFLAIVMVISLLFFAVVDTVIILLTGHISLPIRLAVHLPLIPVVGGLSYEALKASAKNLNNPLVKIGIAPGLWLQRITTKEPDARQLEVAIVALKTALGEEFSNELAGEPVVESPVEAVSA